MFPLLAIGSVPTFCSLSALRSHELSRQLFANQASSKSRLLHAQLETKLIPPSQKTSRTPTRSQTYNADQSSNTPLLYSSQPWRTAALLRKNEECVSCPSVPVTAAAAFPRGGAAAATVGCRCVRMHSRLPTGRQPSRPPIRERCASSRSSCSWCWRECVRC